MVLTNEEWLKYAIILLILVILCIVGTWYEKRDANDCYQPDPFDKDTGYRTRRKRDCQRGSKEYCLCAIQRQARLDCPQAYKPSLLADIGKSHNCSHSGEIS